MANDSLGFRQRQLFEDDHALIVSKTEDHWFDRKSFRISPEGLANLMVGFANADGGTILVGVEEGGRILGVDTDTAHLNRLLQAAIDFTVPPVRHAASLINCLGDGDRDVHVLAIEVHPGNIVHRNHRDETYLRVGDQNRKLSFEATQELLYDKGQTVFDGSVLPGSTIKDLDAAAVESFRSEVGASGEVELALKARGLLVEHHQDLLPTCAAVLLFGSNPEQFVPGAFIRILRYEGEEIQLGTRSNLTLDVRIAGSLPDQIAATEVEMQRHLRSITRLNPETGRFETVPELPRFAWLEAVVNAVAHRSYSQQGDHIRVRLFDDRLEVESPGRLPGSVRIDNIRHTRFSRNPRISRALADLKLVQELNEGMNRMFEEMALAGLPEPVLRQTDSGFIVTLYNGLRRRPASTVGDGRMGIAEQLVPSGFAAVLSELRNHGRITNAQAVALTGMSAPTVRRYLRLLADANVIERVAKSPRDPRSYWQLRRTE
jgi:ATP-dependent DNA helicase RecG